MSPVGHPTDRRSLSFQEHARPMPQVREDRLFRRGEDSAGEALPQNVHQMR